MIGTKMFVSAAAVAFFISATSALAQTDPGVQGGAARAGGPLAGLTANERNFFEAGLEDFEEAEGIGDGLRTGNATVAALRNQNVRMFSDLAVHNMGPGLADDVVQGEALGDEFRTAPLWGLGQRVFFLHDGRTNNLLTAITAHASNGNGTYQASEANTVISRFNALSTTAKQNMLNFLRSL
jgi:CxxC motif-containing protein (DUF1111 family)